MQCSAEQIAEKRRAALERLAQKNRVQAASNGHNPTSALSAGSSFAPKDSPTAPPLRPAFSFKSPQPSRHGAKPYDKPSSAQSAQSSFGPEKTVTGKCSLISEERFWVELSGFSAQAVEVFKSMSSRNYDPKNRHWDFHINEHNQLMAKLKGLRPSVVVEPLPRYVIECVRKPKSDYWSIDLSQIEPELGVALMPFQQDGIRFGIDKCGRFMIADDMGLGKTFQALGIASYYAEDWPLLIVTTASMKNVWESTIHKYLPSVPLMYVQYMTSGKDYIGDSRVLIVSYDMMSRYCDTLLERQFGVLILDESHTVKNFKAKCTKSATELAKKARRVVLLTGTPALSRPCELYSQLALIDDRFLGGFFEFSKRYCDGKTTNFGWDASGKSNLQELEIVMMRKFMIRRTKEDVLKSLPNKVQEVVTLDVKLNEFSKEDRNVLNALAAKYMQEKSGGSKHAALLTFFAETSKIKMPSVCSYILQVLQTDQKFLVFAHHQRMLDAICNVLEKKKVKYIRIDGATTSEQRKYFIDKFQDRDDFLVAVLSITAANAGITLTAAQLVLFAELHWNPSILSQAESRAHRIGQTCAVTVKYLLAPGTADDSIWPMLQEKQRILREAGLCKDSFDNVAVKNQHIDKVERLTENLDVSRITSANTLDITTYFKTSSSANASASNGGAFDDDDDLNDVVGENFTQAALAGADNSAHNDTFDDGLDDIFGNIDV